MPNAQPNPKGSVPRKPPSVLVALKPPGGNGLPKYMLRSAPNVTLWWCYTTAPGTLGDTRHLLGLVSLGMQIQGFKQNREELNVYHLLSYYLLNQMSCTRHQQHKVTPTIYTMWFTMFSMSTNLCASKTIPY